MFKWLRIKEEEQIKKWKTEATVRRAKYLVITFDIVDKFDYPVYDMFSINAIEACYRAVSHTSTRYIVNVFRIDPEGS